jgi:hypothetical protein
VFDVENCSIDTLKVGSVVVGGKEAEASERTFSKLRLRVFSSAVTYTCFFL